MSGPFDFLGLAPSPPRSRRLASSCPSLPSPALPARLPACLPSSPAAGNPSGRRAGKARGMGDFHAHKRAALRPLRARAFSRPAPRRRGGPARPGPPEGQRSPGYGAVGAAGCGRSGGGGGAVAAPGGSAAAAAGSRASAATGPRPLPGTERSPGERGGGGAPPSVGHTSLPRF